MSGKPIVFFWARNKKELEARKDDIESLDNEVGELCFVSDIVKRFSLSEFKEQIEALETIVQDETRFDEQLVLYNIGRTIGTLYSPLQSLSAICPEGDPLFKEVSKLEHISPICFGKEKPKHETPFLRWEVEINKYAVANISKDLNVELKIEELPGFSQLVFKKGTTITLRLIYTQLKTPSHLSRKIILEDNETTPIVRSITLTQNPAMNKQTYPHEIELEIKGVVSVNEKERCCTFCQKQPVTSNLICGNLINKQPFVVLLFGESMAGKTSFVNTIAIAVSQKKEETAIRDYLKVFENKTLNSEKTTYPLWYITGSEEKGNKNHCNTIVVDTPGYKVDELTGDVLDDGSDDLKEKRDAYFKTLLNGTDSVKKVNPLYLPNSVIVVVDGRKEVNAEFYQSFVDCCKSRSIHPILVYTRGVQGVPVKNGYPNFGIHDSHVFVIDCYDVKKKDLRRDNKTDSTVLNILHAAHVESAMHMDITEGLSPEYEFPFIPLTDCPETLCVSCGFSASTYVKGNYVDKSTPVRFNVAGKWVDKIPLKDLEFFYETDERGKIVKIVIPIDIFMRRTDLKGYTIVDSYNSKTQANNLLECLTRSGRMGSENEEQIVYFKCVPKSNIFPNKFL